MSIPYHIENKIYKAVVESTNYSDDVPELKGNKQYLSFRSQILKNKVCFFSKNKKNTELIIKMYNSNKSIAEIQKELDLNPLTIANILFPKNNTILNKRDVENYQYAVDNDITVSDNDEQLSAIVFENKVMKWLDKENVKYITQEELIKKQKKEYGRAVSTPDFLITSDYYVDGVKINWIDAKAYYGAYVPLFFNKKKKQAKKYNDEYGSGAFMFKYGFTSHKKFYFENTLCLDWRF